MYSVVIPVYQAKKDLRRCVESWLTQTEADLELILVDDGSTDGSSVLCDDLAKQFPEKFLRSPALYWVHWPSQLL